MKPTQALNDGVVSIYSVGNTAAAGDMPVEGLTLKGRLHYKRRTVGVERYYKAMQAQTRVDILLRCPFIEQVSTQDIAIPNDGKQYRLTNVQMIEDSAPPMMDLSLERLEADYDLAGIS